MITIWLAKILGLLHEKMPIIIEKASGGVSDIVKSWLTPITKTNTGNYLNFDTDVNNKITSLICNIPNNTTQIDLIHTSGNFIKTTISSQTKNGTLITVNEDGSLTIKNKPSSSFDLIFSTSEIQPIDDTLLFSCLESLPDKVSVKVKQEYLPSHTETTVTLLDPTNRPLSNEYLYSQWIISVKSSYSGDEFTFKPFVGKSIPTEYIKGEYEKKSCSLGNTYNSGKVNLITGKIISGDPEVETYADNSIELNSFIGDNYVFFNNGIVTDIDYFESVGYKIEKEN